MCRIRTSSAWSSSPLVVAWLGPGVSIDRANAELTLLSAALEGAGAGRLRLRLSRPGEEGRDGPLARTMVVFWGASACVLAIVCVNLANLLLARHLGRQREMGVRTALGASRLRIIRLVLMESLLIGALGGAGGVGVGAWGTTALLALRPPALSFVYPDHVPFDPFLVGYSIALSLCVGLIVGVVPAWRAASAGPLRGVTRDGVHVERGVSTRRLFGGAVVLQEALAVVLLIGAGLMMRSYWHLQARDPGFRADSLIQMETELDESAYPDAGVRRERFQELAARVGRLTGVLDVAVANSAPPYSTMMLGVIDVEGGAGVPLRPLVASLARITPDYFRVLRIPLVDGRPLRRQDGSDGAVVVSQSFARKYWPPDDAVGRRFRVDSGQGPGPWLLIVGIVGDIAGRGLTDTADEVYLPYATDRAARGVIVVRVAQQPSLMFQALKEQVWALDPDVPITGIRTVEDGLARSIEEQPFYALLLGTFAAVALALAAVGVFGVTVYTASRRTREIGIRVAMGARAGDVERLIVRQGLAPVLAGIAAGLGGALALARLMSGLVYGVSVMDAAVYGATAFALLAVSIVATWVPARRASRQDPMLALRSE